MLQDKYSLLQNIYRQCTNPHAKVMEFLINSASGVQHRSVLVWNLNAVLYNLISSNVLMFKYIYTLSFCEIFIPPLCNILCKLEQTGNICTYILQINETTCEPRINFSKIITLHCFWGKVVDWRLFRQKCNRRLWLRSQWIDQLLQTSLDKGRTWDHPSCAPCYTVCFQKKCYRKRYATKFIQKHEQDFEQDLSLHIKKIGWGFKN